MALQDKNSDADFKENEKFVQFKQQLRELKKQCKSAASLWLLEMRGLTCEQCPLLCLLHPLPEWLVLLQFRVCLILIPIACLFLKPTVSTKCLTAGEGTWENKIKLKTILLR